MFTPEFFMFRAAKLYSQCLSDKLDKMCRKSEILPDAEPQEEQKRKPATKSRKTQKYVNSRRVRANRCRGGSK